MTRSEGTGTVTVKSKQEGNVKESKKSDKRKLVLNRDEPEDSDDSFETAMKKNREVVGAEPEWKKRKCLNKKDYKSICIRNPPLKLISIMKDFTLEQQNSVKKMGFESVLGTTVGKMPLKLGLWLVENYDPDSNTLQIGNKSLIITRQTMNDVYGFPMGNTPINASERASLDNIVVQEFQNLFSSKDGRVKLGNVLPELVKDVTGGRKFILSFLVSVMTIFLGCCNTYGEVNQKFLPDIQADTDIKDLDWCTYALECLNSARRSWDFMKKDMYFTGPLLFLVVLYVSSTIFPGEIIERRFPLMNCWTTEKLKKREANEMTNGGFGKLKIADGVVLVDNDADDEVFIHTVEEVLESQDMAQCSGHNEALEFIPELTLSQHPPEQLIDLSRLGAVSQDERVEIVDPSHRQKTWSPFGDFQFSESPTRYIIYDWVLKQRVMFLKKAIEVEAPPQFPPHLMPILNPHADMISNSKDLISTQLSRSQKQLDDMMLIVSNMQKDMQQQAFEAKRRDQERELLEQERENRAQEREKRSEEREKRAELQAHAMTNNLQNMMNKQSEEQHEKMIMMGKNMQKQKEKQEEEREKRADIRAHAIIWDIERQRYLYEQEQRQLRMAWNQGNCVNAVDEFQFPQISHTSFHPPRVGSLYYDPTQCNEIPQAFQSLYHDIYGPTDQETRYQHV